MNDLIEKLNKKYDIYQIQITVKDDKYYGEILVKRGKGMYSVKQAMNCNSYELMIKLLMRENDKVFLDNENYTLSKN